MEPNKFIAEVYRRLDMVDSRFIDSIDPDSFLNNKFVKNSVKEYQKVLPQNKDKKILDIGFGMGKFSAACIHLGYENIHCADFGAKYKLLKVCKEFPQIKDRYGRILGICGYDFLDAYFPYSLNAWMVKNGHAVAYKEYSKMFIKFEDEAKKSKKGIWQGEFERPNLWRKKNK